jgi:hypothetical protein
MIISEYVEILLDNRNFKKYTKKYDIPSTYKIGDTYKIPIYKLTKGSNYLVDVSCDYCGVILNVSYKRYNSLIKTINKYSCSAKDCSNKKIKDVCQIRYGVDNPFQVEFIKDKIKDTLNDKYGVSHPMFLQETKDKIKNTNLEKYGVINYTKTDEYKEKTINTNLEKYGVEYEQKTIEGQYKRKKTRIERGLQIPDELVSEYRRYRLCANRYLSRNKKNILCNWDGFDYYDGEYIKDNFNLKPEDRLYPHFDHKISVAYAFKNNLDIEIINNLDNICITKQWINGLKKEMNEKDFILIFNK